MKTINLPSTFVTMSSREIARLTEKRHSDVLRDIRTLIARLERYPEKSGDLRFNLETVKKSKKGRPQQTYHLDEELTLTLISGYYPEYRKQIVHHFLYLRQCIEKPYQKLQNLSVDIRVSQRLGQIGSEMMNKRKREKTVLLKKEQKLINQIQMTLNFDPRD